MRNWKRFRPARYFDDQLKEIKAYRELISQNNQRIWGHVPEFYGTEETDMGLGITTKLYRNFDGSLPKNLRDILPGGMSEALRQGIVEFSEWIRREAVVTRDLLPHNMIAVTQEDHSVRILIVDGIGNSEFIPLATWFRTCAKLKIGRKLKKLRHRIDILLPATDS
jgi:hypothetical protein